LSVLLDLLLVGSDLRSQRRLETFLLLQHRFVRGLQRRKWFPGGQAASAYKLGEATLRNLIAAAMTRRPLRDTASGGSGGSIGIAESRRERRIRGRPRGSILQMMW
jgi:hypothetical protein